jgi:hypothetical protein
VQLPKFVMRRIQLWCDHMMITREPDFYIGGQEDPYMIRWWVIPRNRWFNLYMHKVLKSDRDEALHDHPWINMSLLVRGSYDEITIANGGVQHSSPLKEGHLRLRGPSAAHRLVVDETGEAEPVITLFFTGPVWRHWGFHCRNGWRHWKDFIGFRDQKQNIIGRGCGEMDGPALKGGHISIFKGLMPSTDKRPKLMAGATNPSLRGEPAGPKLPAQG